MKNLPSRKLEDKMVKLQTECRKTINRLLDNTNKKNWEEVDCDVHGKYDCYNFKEEITTEQYDECPVIVSIIADGEEFIVDEGDEFLKHHDVQNYPIEILFQVIRQLEKDQRRKK